MNKIIGLLVVLIIIPNLGFGAFNKANNLYQPDSAFKTIKRKETMFFNNSGYATINGSIRNFIKYYSEDRNIRVSVNDYITGEQLSYFSDIDSLGRFSVSFPLLHQQDVLLVYRQKWTGVFVQLNDTLNINFDADTFPESMNFTGMNANNSKEYFSLLLFDHNNINAEHNYMKNNQHLSDSLSFKEYKQWRDSIYIQKTNRINSFCTENHYISDGSISIKRSEELYYYSDLMRCHSFIKRKNDSIASAFVNSFRIDSSYLISSEFILFVNKLTNYYLVKSSYLFSTSKSKINHPESPSIPMSSDEEEQLHFNCYIATISKLNDSFIKDLLVTNRLFQILKKSNIDLVNESNVELISDTIIKKRFLGLVNNLKYTKENLNAFKTVNYNDGDRLLNDLKEKYKNKIIYIDLWGTWCSPCFIEMKKAEKIKKIYKNNEVAFVYLCCESDRNIWEKKIKELNISGEHICLNSKQYKDFYLKFNISGIPRYILINRKGKIVNTNAPRPSDEKNLIKEINNWINN